MSVFIQRQGTTSEIPQEAEWLLPLRENEWLADDAEASLPSLLAHVSPNCEAVAMPMYLYIGSRVLTGSAFDSLCEIRLSRVRAEARVRPHLFKSVSSAPSLKYEVLPAGASPRVHRRVGEDLRDFTKRRMEQALAASNDVSESILNRAWAAIGAATDDDLSRAASLVEAWARLLEGLFAAQDRGDSINGLLALPVATVRREILIGSVTAQSQERLSGLAAERDRLAAELTEAKQQQSHLTHELSKMRVMDKGPGKSLKTLLRSIAKKIATK